MITKEEKEAALRELKMSLQIRINKLTILDISITEGEDYVTYCAEAKATSYVPVKNPPTFFPNAGTRL